MPQQTGSARSYELLLIAVIAARATSFIFSKMILESLAPFNLLAVRFIIAFVLLALIFNKAVRSLAARDLLAGTVIGTAFFITMACEMIALTQAASSLVSLLENCAIIFVPLLEILLYKKLPGKLTVISTGMAMFGVVLLALGQGELSGGFTWGLAAGLCYAAAIIVTERLSHGSTATLGIGIVQVGTMGVLSFFAMLLTETPQLPQFQHRGYAKSLINFIEAKYKGRFKILQAGTGDSPATVPFYQKLGFIRSHIIKNFFTNNYSRPIYDGGVLLTDMVYLRKKL